jgi:hypothetical protein
MYPLVFNRTVFIKQSYEVNDDVTKRYRRLLTLRILKDNHDRKIGTKLNILDIRDSSYGPTVGTLLAM